MNSKEIIKIFNDYLGAFGKRAIELQSEKEQEKIRKAMSDAIKILKSEGNVDPWPVNLLLKLGIVPDNGRETERLLKNLMKVLDTVQDKDVLLDYYRDGLSYADIGKKNDYKDSTAEYRVKRGTKALRNAERLFTICAGEDAKNLSKNLEKEIAAKLRERKDTSAQFDEKTTEEVLTPLFEQSVDNLYLDTRPTLALKRSGIERIGQLQGLTRKDLLKFRTMGEKSADLIIDRAKELGIDIERDS